MFQIRTSSSRKTLAVIQLDMTVKKNIFAIAISLISLTINSCDSNDDANIISQSSPLIKKVDEFKQIRDSSNILVIKLYDLGSDSSLGQDLSNGIWQDSINDTKRIEDFGNLFKFVKNGGYCCCAKTHYTLKFYKNRNELDTYYVDTTDVLDKVTVFTSAYQNSYIISLKDFNSFIRKE